MTLLLLIFQIGSGAPPPVTQAGGGGLGAEMNDRFTDRYVDRYQETLRKQGKP